MYWPSENVKRAKLKKRLVKLLFEEEMSSHSKRIQLALINSNVCGYALAIEDFT